MFVWITKLVILKKLTKHISSDISEKCICHHMTNLLSRAFWDISYYLHQGILNEYSFSFLKFIICVELVRQNYQTHVLLCINILNKHKPSKKDTSGIISGSKMTPKNILRIIAWLNTYFNKNFNSFQPLPVDLVSFPVQKLVQKSSSRMI